MKIQHQLLVIDEGRQQLSNVDTAKDEIAWTIGLEAYPLARDMQRLDHERALIGFDRGFLEIDIASGRILDVCERWSDVSAVCRLPNGSTLITGFNLDGTGGINVLTLNRARNVINVARRDGDYVRLMRMTAAGTYLLCMNDHILEVTPTLTNVRRFAVSGFQHAWKAERRADGSTLVSAGYGAFMALFDINGDYVRQFGAATNVPDEVAPFFYASFEQLPDGRLLVANWQGHGPGNGHKGCQLLEFDVSGHLQGQWSAGEHISSLQGLLLI